MDLVEKVFVPVRKRLLKRKDSLRALQRFQRTGIEGWFKVEVIAALGPIVAKIQNNRADLLLRDGEESQEVELKAGTGFRIAYLRNGASKYAGAPCLFLCNGSDHKKVELLAGDDFTLVKKFLYDGLNEWVLGLLKIKSPDPDRS